MTSKNLKKVAVKVSTFKKNIPFLNVIKDLTPDQRIIILSHLDSKSAKTIIQCIKKVLRGRGLKNSQREDLKNRLLPQKDLLRKIVSEKKLKQKQKHLPKIGGSLGLILGTLIPILIDFARKNKWI